jgi:hypothetical protein
VSATEEYPETPEAEDPRPQEGVRVGFSTPKHFNPVSWLVRKFTGSRASHAFFIYHDADWDAEMVMEAHEVGFRLVPLAKFEKLNRLVKVVSPKYPIDEGTKKVALQYVGSRYDFEGLIGMVVVMVGRWLKKKWQNPFRSAKNVFCSEAVIRAMLGSPGYATGLPLAPESSPEDLLVYFEKVEGV